MPDSRDELDSHRVDRINRGTYWFDFDDLSDAESSDAVSDRCWQDSTNVKIKSLAEQNLVSIKGYIEQLVEKLIHGKRRPSAECVQGQVADSDLDLNSSELSESCTANKTEGENIAEALCGSDCDVLEEPGHLGMERVVDDGSCSHPLSDCKGDPQHGSASTDVGDGVALHSEDCIASTCLFDWDDLPDVVLSQHARAVLYADLVDGGSADVEKDMSSDLPERWLCCDADGQARGKCKNCDNCETCVLSDHSYICWEPVGRLQKHPMVCERCNCALSDHESCQFWHSRVKTSLKRFRDTGGNTKMLRPARSQMPVAALGWDADEVALYVLTEALFDPRKHGRMQRPGSASWGENEEMAAKAEEKPLVSCITPTSSARQSFHPLLYECFRLQNYEPKELIVIETGETPSVFLQECSRSDPRVIYRYWPVDDARMQDLAETVMEPAPAQPAWNTKPGGFGKGSSKGSAQTTWQDQRRWSQFQQDEKHRQHTARLKAKLRGKVRGGKRQQGWTLGMKRNIACHLARGDVIAHMDDDDLYASIYLDHMVAKLQEAARYRPLNGRLPAAAATLEAWHVLDLSDQTFGFFAPKGEELLDQVMKESFAYGFGFSYVYSKAAWDLQAFADVEWSEDGHFTTGLLERQRPVKLVNPRFIGNGIDAIAAHSHHRDTTSGGEFTEITYTEHGSYRSVTKAVRMGKKVTTPKELAGLLPLVRSIVAGNKISRYDVHPVRQEVTLNSVKGEIGLEQKQEFMRRYGAGLGQWPRMQQPQIWAPNAQNLGKGVLQWGKGKGKGKSTGWPWAHHGIQPPAHRPIRV